MLIFLKVNGYRLGATDPELAGWIINLSGDLTPEQLTDAVRPRLVPAQPG